ncbi:lactate/malate family dehydrogenase [Campylobacter majalis]|uniref:lactate/malate family dehydrogenase n=1 Tax=Campylobacter majalis TaxID=2790656 RepID=UPI003D6840CD
MKISIIGAGNVGASIAYALAMRNVCDEIVLLDIYADVAKAKAMDITQANIVFNSDIFVVGGDDYELLQNSDIVVITAGSPRKQGESRQDLLLKNAKVVKQSTIHIVKHAPSAIIIVVTNPLDEMTYVAFNCSGFNSSRVIGMAGELDTARLKFELNKHANVKISNLTSYVIGAHNDEMTIVKNGCNIDDFEKIQMLARKGGASIVALLGTSAYYAPAAGVVKICEAIKNDSKTEQSVCLAIGKDLAIGVRAIIGKNGAQEIKKSDEISEQSKQNIIKNIKFLSEIL